MDLRKRLFAILMSLTMVLTYMPALAFAAGDEAPADTGAAAAEEATQDAGNDDVSVQEDADPVTEEQSSEEENTSVPVIVPTEPKTETYKPGEGSDEDTDLLQSFVDEKVKEEIAAKDKNRKYSKSRKTTLSGSDLLIYNALVPQIEAVASGQSADTTFTVPVSDVFDKLSFTAEDLGVESIFVETGEVDEEGTPLIDISEDAMEEFDSWFSYDMSLIVDALLADYPYELYWFDKVTGGVTSSISGFSPVFNQYEEDGEIYTEEMLSYDADSEIEFKFFVSADYSANAGFNDQGEFERGDLRTTSVNTELTSAAASAASNIAGIVTANKDEQDIDKLYNYKDEICDLVDYNDAAAAVPQTPYGDPWQLIFVFDADNDTKVVCEGYSKAFQYLCDNTLFDHARIDCYSVSGLMDGGNHMWNILHMEDGKNYMADVTNCDEDSVGNPDKLFLKGYTSGDMNDGYAFDCNDPGQNFDSNIVNYSYDEDTLALFKGAQLKLSAEDYGNAVQPEPQDNDGYEFVQDQTIVKGEWRYFPLYPEVIYEKDGNEKKGTYTVTDFSVVSQNSETDEDVITNLEIDEECEEWTFKANEFGTAVIRVDYEKLDGSAASYTFKATVTDESYSLKAYPDEGFESVESVLPGGEYRLYASGTRTAISPSNYEEPTFTTWFEDPDDYKWELIDGGDAYADISTSVSEESGLVASVRVKDAETLKAALGTDRISLKLGVKVSLVAGNTELASDTLYINVSDDFVTLEPLSLPPMRMFAPETVSAKVNRYTAGNDEPEAVSDATFTWIIDDEYKDALKIEEGDTAGGVTEYTITRLENCSVPVTLKAEYGGGKTIERDFELDEEDAYFNIYTYNRVYNDKDSVFDIVLPYFYADKAEDYKFVVKVGDHSSEDENSGVTYELVSYEGEDEEDEEEGTRYKAVVTADRAVTKNAGDSIDITAELVPKAAEYSDKVAYTETYRANIISSVSYEDLPSGETEILLGDDIYCYSFGQATIHNGYESENKSYHVTGMTAAEGAENVLISRGDESWSIRGTKAGDAEITVSGYYGDDETDAFTHSFTVHVRGDIYTVSIQSGTDIGTVVPGSTVTLNADVEHQSVSGDTSTDDLDYEWQIVSEDFSDAAEFIDSEGNVITDPAGDTVKIRFKWPAGMGDESSAYLSVRVLVKKNGADLAEDEINLRVAKYSTEITLEGFSGMMNVGETKEFPIHITHYDPEHPDGLAVDPADPEIEYEIDNQDEDAADISVEGGKVVITLKADDDAEFYLSVFRSGTPFIDSYQWFSVIPAGDPVVPPCDHNWSDVTYDPTPENFDPDNDTVVTASRYCTNDGCNETESEQATIVVSTEAETCTDPGRVTYTATFENEAFNTWTTERELASVGHSWGTVTYSWSPDKSSVTALRTCRKCGEEETETVQTNIETVEPSCGVAGEKTYTAVFSNPAFITQTKTEELEALEHNTTHHAKKDPTYDEAGNIEYWYCSNCGKYFSDEACENEISEDETVIPAKDKAAALEEVSTNVAVAEEAADNAEAAAKTAAEAVAALSAATEAAVEAANLAADTPNAGNIADANEKLSTAREKKDAADTAIALAEAAKSAADNAVAEAKRIISEAESEGLDTGDAMDRAESAESRAGTVGTNIEGLSGQVESSASELETAEDMIPETGDDPHEYPWIEFHTNDMDMLCGSSTELRKDVVVFPDSESDGEEKEFRIKSVSVDNHPAEAGGGNPVVVHHYDEDDYYDIDARIPGYAVITVIYLDDSNKEVKHTFKVNVVTEEYTCWIDTAGDYTDTTIPGGSIGLVARAEKAYYENGNVRYADVTDDLNYEWSLAEGGSLATITSNKNTSTVKFNSDITEDDSVSVSLKARDSAGNLLWDSADGGHYKFLNVKTEYYEIVSDGFDTDAEANEAQTITVSLRRFRNGSSQLVGNVKFSWTDLGDDDYALSVDKMSDTGTTCTFRLTKPTANGVSATLLAEWDSNGQSVERTFMLNSTSHDFIFLEEDDFTMDYSENRTFTIDTANITKELDNGYTLAFRVGEWEWNDVEDFTKFYDDSCYTVDGNKITLLGSKLQDAGAETICIRAELRKGDVVVDYQNLYGDIGDGSGSGDVYSDAQESVSDAEEAAVGLSDSSSNAEINNAQSLADRAVSDADDAVQAARDALDDAMESGDPDKISEAKQTLADAQLTQAKARVISRKVTAVSTSKAASSAKAAVSNTSAGTSANVNAAQAAKTAADKAKQAAADEVAAAEALVKAAEAAGNAGAKAEADKMLAAAKSDFAKADAEAKAAASRLDTAKKAAADAKAKAAAEAEKLARDGVLDKKIPKVKISKPVVKKNTITAKWKKLTKKQLKKSKAKKYEIWVCPNKKFAKEDTKEKIVSKSKSSFKFKGLRKKTKYYVKVRAIRYAGGTKYVGKWSKVKSIKTK